MYILSALPSRVQSDRTLFKEVYFRALHGVSRHSLEVAVQNIIQGHSELQHGFLPSPPELRQTCDAVMKPILDARAWDAERDRVLREQRAEQSQREASQASWTPESRARASAKWQQVKAKIQAENAAEKTNTGGYDTSKEAALARLQKAAEDNGNQFNLDALKSSTSNTFKQVGAAA